MPAAIALRDDPLLSCVGEAGFGSALCLDDACYGRAVNGKRYGSG